MLILTRKEGEILEVTIPETGETLVLMVSEIKRGQVKLGMTCPRHWNIRRMEVDGLRAPLASEANKGAPRPDDDARHKGPVRPDHTEYPDTPMRPDGKPVKVTKAVKDRTTVKDKMTARVTKKPPAS